MYDVIINVDTVNPTKNLFFKIFFFDNVVVDGYVHDGVNILLPSIEADDYRRGLYHASLKPEKNEVVITIPSGGFPFMSEPDFENFYQRLAAKGMAGVDQMKLVHSMCRTSLSEAPNGLIQRILLRFPADCVLGQGIWRKQPNRRMVTEMDESSIDSTAVIYDTKDGSPKMSLSWTLEQMTEGPPRKITQQVGVSFDKELNDLIQEYRGLRTDGR